MAPKLICFARPCESLSTSSQSAGNRITPVLITLVMVALAVPLGWAIWDAYMGAAWTRDGTVRVYVVDEVPEGVVLVAGMTAKVQIDPRPRPQAK
jgi:multidrug resistance efflux pump